MIEYKRYSTKGWLFMQMQATACTIGPFAASEFVFHFLKYAKKCKEEKGC